jgi:predicted nucleotidyltransferase
VLAAARTWASDLQGRHPEIVRIGYFGSYATGTFGPGSDLDVLIEVTAAAQNRLADRAASYLPDHFPVAIELFVFTSSELERLRREGSSFAAAVDEVVQYVASPRRPRGTREPQ